jgi:hypothetical protein
MIKFEYYFKLIMSYCKYCHIHIAKNKQKYCSQSCNNAAIDRHIVKPGETKCGNILCNYNAGINVVTGKYYPGKPCSKQCFMTILRLKQNDL